MSDVNKYIDVLNYILYIMLYLTISIVGSGIVSAITLSIILK